MAEKKKEGDEEKGGEAPAPKSKKKLIIIIVVVLLLAGGGGAFFALSGGDKNAEEAAKEEEVHPRELKRVKLDPFIVNLSEAKSFLKVSILVEYDPEILAKVTGGEAGGEGHGGGGAGGEGGEGGGEGGLPPAMMEKEPIIRDRVIGVLASKTPSDVLSKTGKETLKEEIIEAINDALEFPEPVVVAVYFTEFMIQ